MAMMTQTSESLPADLVTEILSRLPLKSLCCFRAVSKHWLCFLTNFRFSYSLLSRHLHCSSLEDCPHNESSIFLFYDSTTATKRTRRQLEETESPPDRCKLYSVGGGLSEDSFKLAFQVDFPPVGGKSFEIKTGSCHGMLCLSIDGADSYESTLVLWNPSIHEHKVLPLPCDLGICAGVCGLGFDPSMDDYKVLSFCENQVHVFSLKKNLWKNLGRFDYSLFYEGVPVSGCLYWGASKVSKFAERILCFNLSDETFREVPPPPFESTTPPETVWSFPGQLFQDNHALKTELNLLLYGNSLCLFRQYDQTLWVMKQEHEENGHGVKETWTQLLTVPKIINRESRARIPYRLHPKCFTKNGKLIISISRRRFVMYDGVNHKNLDIKGLVDDRFLNAFVHSESLISPNSIRSMDDID